MTRVVVDNKPLIKVVRSDGGRDFLGRYVGNNLRMGIWWRKSWNQETLVINLSSNYHPGLQIFNDSNSTSVGQYITLDGFIHRAGGFAIWQQIVKHKLKEGLTVKKTARSSSRGSLPYSLKTGME